MRIGLKVTLFLGVIVICLTGLWFFYYEGTYVPPLIRKPGYEAITATPAPHPSQLTEVYREGEGTVLIDLAHDNNFTLGEINPLVLGIVSRGSHIDYLRKEGEEIGSVSKKLQEKLRLADVLVVISPRASYSGEEARLASEFVRKGGKLLLIADPTRPSNVNSVSSEFGLVFENGYLYHLTENEGNFRNIFISKFASNELTRNLVKIVFYTAGYISPTTNGIAFTDDNTSTSVVETKGRFSPVALSANSTVLAISDFTFMTEPHNTVYDNNKFISNIADWLTKSERLFLLSDFPYCLSEDVDIIYSDPSALDMATRLKVMLGNIGQEAAISQHQTPITVSKDTLFLGLFETTEAVKSYLDGADIHISTEDETITIEIGTMGNVYKKGTSLLYLSGEGDKRLLLVLADTEDMLEETVDLLEKGEFRQWLVTDRLAICRSQQIEAAKAPENEK